MSRPIWKRIKAGHYTNGKFEIIKDPTGGNYRGGWGFCSWLIYEVGGDTPYIQEHFPTLKAAKEEVEG